MKMFWHENMNENPGYFKPPHNHPTINLFKLNWKKLISKPISYHRNKFYAHLFEISHFDGAIIVADHWR